MPWHVTAVCEQQDEMEEIEASDFAHPLLQTAIDSACLVHESLLGLRHPDVDRNCMCLAQVTIGI